MIRTLIFALATAASLPTAGIDAAGIDAARPIRRGEVVAGAVVRMPTRPVEAASPPLGDNGRVRGAIVACVAEAERRAPGTGADVLDVGSITADRKGYAVSGRVAVNRLGRAWREGDRVHGRGWRGDFRGWRRALRGYDVLRFACHAAEDRVTVTFM